MKNNIKKQEAAKMQEIEKRQEVANRIKVLRSSKKISQEKMAELMGVTYSTYMKIENAYQNLTVKHLINVAKILDVSTDALLFDEDKRPNTLSVAEFAKYADIFDEDELLSVNDKIQMILQLKDKQ